MYCRRRQLIHVSSSVVDSAHLEFLRAHKFHRRSPDYDARHHLNAPPSAHARMHPEIRESDNISDEKGYAHTHENV